MTWNYIPSDFNDILENLNRDENSCKIYECFLIK